MMSRAAVYAQLGRLDDAVAIWREVEARVPGYTARLHLELTKWFQPDHVAHIEEAVAKILRHSSVNPTQTPNEGTQEPRSRSFRSPTSAPRRTRIGSATASRRRS